MTRNTTNVPTFISLYTPTMPTFTVIVTRHNGRVFTTDAEGLEMARMLAESHVGKNSIGWKAAILDENGGLCGTYEWGTVKKTRGWR